MDRYRSILRSEQHTSTEEVRPINRRRIEYDPNELDPDTRGLVEAVRRLLADQREEQVADAVYRSGQIERAAKGVTGRALLAADRSTGGPINRRDLAQVYGRAHAAINRRIAATQPEGEDMPASTRTVVGARLKAGDLVTDPSGSYEQYGPITNVDRHGVHYIATTESGTELSFLSFDLVRIDRQEGSR